MPWNTISNTDQFVLLVFLSSLLVLEIYYVVLFALVYAKEILFRLQEKLSVSSYSQKDSIWVIHFFHYSFLNIEI